jgi:hypothetical protein
MAQQNRRGYLVSVKILRVRFNVAVERTAADRSSSHQYTCFENSPRHPLVGLPPEARYAPNRHFADVKSRRPARWKLQDLLLDVWREPDHFDDLAHPFQP